MAGHLGERGAGLVVGNVALARVREQRQHGSDALRGRGAAGRDGDQQLHQMVVHLPAARLDDKDILAADALSNLHARLADGKFAKQDVRRRYAQVVADGGSQLRVRVAAEHDEVANHGGGDVRGVRAARRRGEGEDEVGGGWSERRVVDAAKE